MDFRDFIEDLEKEGEVNTIEKEVHWNIEAPALAAMSNRVGGPAIHFKNIKGYPEGYSLLGSPYTGPGTLFPGRKRNFFTRIAIALELDRNIGYEDLMETLIDRKLHPIFPTEFILAMISISSNFPSRIFTMEPGEDTEPAAL